MLFNCQNSVFKLRGPFGFVSTCITFCLYHCLRARGADQFGYRWELYKEEGGRIQVQTDSGLFTIQPAPWVTATGEVVYDAISGLTPTGAPPPSTITNWADPHNLPPGASSTKVPLTVMHDVRVSGSMGITLIQGAQRYTPSFSYGQEHDYRSRGASLNYSHDYNEKNTTLNLGWAHDWDQVLPNGFLFARQNKESDDLMIGLNQLLGPKTVFTANLSYGHARGYLNDQYRGVLADNIPQGDATEPATDPEVRPRKRDRYTAYFSLTQDVTPLNASVEGAYRIFRDSYGITANSLDVAWFQKIGKHVVVSPMVRFYLQNAAFFYVTRIADDTAPPAYYSADYRLSELYSYTLGLTVNWKIKDWFSLDAGFKRYAMVGLDNVTSPSAFPKANIFTMGGRIWF